MGRAIKYFAITLVSIVLLIAIAAASLAFWIDPNIFKNDIEKIASEQGLTLHLNGDLSWQVFPNIQIVINGATVSPKNEAEIMRFDKAQLSVALMPLLKKDIVVQGISLDGVKASLIVDENGVGNWTKIGKQDSKSASEPEKPSDEPQKAMQLAIAKLTLSNSNISYTDKQTGQHVELNALSLSGENIQLDNKAFPLNLESDFSFIDDTQSVSGKTQINSNITVNSEINHFVIGDGKLSLTIDHKNDLSSISLSTELALDAEVDTTKALEWAVPRLSFADTSLRYAAKDGTNIDITALSFEGGITPGGEAKAINIRGDVRYGTATQKPIETNLSLSSVVSIDEKLNSIKAKEIAIKTRIGDEAIAITGDASASLSPLDYQAKLSLANANFKKIADTLGIELPDMSEPSALNKVGAAFSVKGNDKRIVISELRTTLDDSTITGNASVDIDKNQAVKLALNIDKINVDHYLAPVAEEENKPSDAKKAEPKAGSSADAEIPLPRELLNSLDIDAKLQIGELTASQLPFKNILLQLIAKNGVSSVSPLSGIVYDSPFTVDAQLDTRPAAARMLIRGSSKQLPLGKVLKDAAAIEELSGISDVSFNLSTNGTSVAALKKHLDGNIDLSAQQLRLSNMNIEKAFCQLVAKFQQETFDPTNWPIYSDLKDTTTKIVIKDGIARIETLNSGVTKLALSGNGKIDLNEDTFDIVIKTRLAQADQDAMTCKINNDKLLNRDIPIRCKAAFDKVGATSCLPDFRVIEDIAKEKAKDKIDEKAKEFIDKKMGGENGEAAKQIFNQFFKK
ncbi:AsmA family protein [Zhongshania sp. BJYM1]|uniref:AsmA family protein n=1 Tax=Zhongshania aquatica TaxID=2965069 RepID=UPI0022B3BC2C|nr:AsmA family protein [Marortus sp. BJYM1]